MRCVFGGSRPLMAAAKAAAEKTAKNTEDKAAKVMPKNNPLLKQHPLSEDMRKFVGKPEISRAEATKKVWDYIKLQKLQNPEKKSEILCDAKLKTILAGRDKVGMFEMAKLMSPHFLKEEAAKN